MATRSLSEFQEQAPSQFTQSKASEVRLIPYVEIDGARTLPDSYLADVFDEMVVAGLVSTVFVSALVNTADDFISLMKHPSNIPVFVLDGMQCIGFAWLNGVGANHAYGHFCYFENDVSAVECGRQVVDYWFGLSGKDGPYLDVILGAVPAFNKRASAFVRKLGFVKLGEIPNLCVNKFTGEKWPSVIHYCVRP